MRLMIYLAAIFLVLPLAIEAQPRIPPRSAPPSLPEEIQEIGDLISPEQIEAFQKGKDPSEIILRTGGTLADFLSTKSTEPTFEIGWFAFTCGGGTSTGTSAGGESGDVQVKSLCGQSVGTIAKAGDFELEPISEGDIPIFSDGFESSNMDAWSIQVTNQ